MNYYRKLIIPSRRYLKSIGFLQPAMVKERNESPIIIEKLKQLNKNPFAGINSPEAQSELKKNFYKSKANQYFKPGCYVFTDPKANPRVNYRYQKINYTRRCRLYQIYSCDFRQIVRKYHRSTDFQTVWINKQGWTKITVIA